MLCVEKNTQKWFNVYVQYCMYQHSLGGIGQASHKTCSTELCTVNELITGTAQLTLGVNFL